MFYKECVAAAESLDSSKNETGVSEEDLHEEVTAEKENDPPVMQEVTKPEKRATAGVLQPSDHVIYVPLEVQKGILDSESKAKDFVAFANTPAHPYPHLPCSPKADINSNVPSPKSDSAKEEKVEAKDTHHKSPNNQDSVGSDAESDEKGAESALQKKAEYNSEPPPENVNCGASVEPMEEAAGEEPTSPIISDSEEAQSKESSPKAASTDISTDDAINALGGKELQVDQSMAGIIDNAG